MAGSGGVAPEPDLGLDSTGRPPSRLATSAVTPTTSSSNSATTSPSVKITGARPQTCHPTGGQPWAAH